MCAKEGREGRSSQVDGKSKRSKEEISTPRSVDKGRLHKHKDIGALSESDFLNNVVPGHGSPILNMEQSKGSPATSKLESGEFQESSFKPFTYKVSPTFPTTSSPVFSPRPSPSPLVLKQSESNGKGGGNPSKLQGSSEALSPVPFPELPDSTPMSSESKLKKGTVRSSSTPGSMPSEIYGNARRDSFPQTQKKLEFGNQNGGGKGGSSDTIK